MQRRQNFLGFLVLLSLDPRALGALLFNLRNQLTCGLELDSSRPSHPLGCRPYGAILSQALEPAAAGTRTIGTPRRNQPWARALTMLSVDAKNARYGRCPGIPTICGTLRTRRAHSAPPWLSRQEDWKAGRPLPQLSALPFNFGLFPLLFSCYAP